MPSLHPWFAFLIFLIFYDLPHLAVIIKKLEMTGSWNPGIPLYAILPIYFFALYPAVQFLGIPRYAYPCFQAITLLAMIRQATQLGWSTQHIRQHLMIGLACGAMVVGALPLLNLWYPGEMLSRPADETNIAVSILFLPVLEQSFFTGLIAQSLLKKCTPILAIYLAAIIFTLAHFTLNLGTFFMGFIATGLYYLTGTLYASLAFHIACQAGWVLLVQTYPHLITLLGFLF